MGGQAAQVLAFALLGLNRFIAGIIVSISRSYISPLWLCSSLINVTRFIIENAEVR